MESIALPLSLKREMLEHAAAGHPCEVGGFVVGRPGDLPHRLARVANVHDEPEAHIDFDPRDVLVAFEEMDAEGTDDVAVYHSHPLTGSATLSTRDLHYAPDLSAVYIVIAPRAVPSVQAWRILEQVDGVAMSRSAEEIPIRWTNDDDDLETLRGLLAADSVVALTYRRSDYRTGGEHVHLPRVRVAHLLTETVVVLVDRRQVRINLDRVADVELIEPAAAAAGQRTFAAKLLVEASEEMTSGRIGASRTCIEAACRAVPGLRPRMDPDVR